MNYLEVVKHKDEAGESSRMVFEKAPRSELPGTDSILFVVCIFCMFNAWCCCTRFAKNNGEVF